MSNPQLFGTLMAYLVQSYIWLEIKITLLVCWNYIFKCIHLFYATFYLFHFSCPRRGQWILFNGRPRGRLSPYKPNFETGIYIHNQTALNSSFSPKKVVSSFPCLRAQINMTQRQKVGMFEIFQIDEQETLFLNIIWIDIRYQWVLRCCKIWAKDNKEHARFSLLSL